MSSANYNSNNGMLTYVWGPPKWFYLHTMSFNYPVNPTKEQKKWTRLYVESLQYTLPCGACRENLKKNLKQHKLTATALKNRANFSRWMYELHELVNRMLGKESGLTFEEVRDQFEHFRAQCGSAKPKRTVEKGCTKQTVGYVKSKCVLSIVPKTSQRKTLTISQKCKK